MTADDKQLISQIAEGNERAFITLYDRYCNRVYTLALHIMHDQMAAEEVLQETFLKLWNHADQYMPGRGPLNIWLLTIARRTALERLRFESHRPSLFDEDDPSSLLESFPEPETSTEEARWRSLYLAVQALPRDEKRVIEMAYYQGLSQSEISELLDMPLGTVKTHVRTGMSRLRKQWLDDESS